MQNARDVSQQQNISATSEDTLIDVLPLSGASHVPEGTVNQRDNNITSPDSNAANDNGNSSKKDTTLKKIFEKGKVCINFPSYPSSDSEVEIDYIEEVPISTRGTSSRDDTWDSDNDTLHGYTLKSVIAIPEASTSTREELNERAHHCHSNSDGERHSNDGIRSEKHKRSKRKHSKQGESSHSMKSGHSRQHKKHKKHRHASRSPSVEFIEETM